MGVDRYMSAERDRADWLTAENDRLRQIIDEAVTHIETLVDILIDYTTDPAIAAAIAFAEEH